MKHRFTSSPLVLSILAVASFALPLHTSEAAPGDVNAFNPDLNGFVSSSAILPDGTLYLTGQFSTVGMANRTGIARFLPNGTFDASFNPNNSNICERVYVQSDNQVLIAGFFTTWEGQSFERIVRIDADGNHDTSFNPSPNDDINSILQQDDGKLIVAGRFTSIDGQMVNRIARLDTDGSLDATFNVGMGADGEVDALAFQDDGKILVMGEFANIDGTARTGFARLNANGSLDTTYDPGFDGTNVFSINKLPDGKFLVCGIFGTSNGAFAAMAPEFLVRLNADGTLDTTFTPNLTGGGVFSAVPQVNGKIILASNLSKIDDIDVELFNRINGDGTLDTTFDYLLTPGGGRDAIVKDNGNLFLGGFFAEINGTTRNRAAEVEYEATTDELSHSPNGTKLFWTRSGNNAVVHRVRFEISTDGGTIWTPLGFASRVGATSTWELGGLSLPLGDFMVRASGYIGHGGGLGATSSGYESVDTLTRVAVVDNSLLRARLLKKIKKLVKKVKRFRRNGKVAKVKKLRKKIRKLGKRVRRL
ncbi:MAG: hypothetical protein CMO55_12065 [Verrucomicrobiales bacterium]|nr:hypothetical protein [Verrucomicrobiales bacterium]